MRVGRLVRIFAAVVLATGAAVVAATPATAARPGPGRDTQPPSTPANLHATAVTQTSVSLAWNASTDNVGVLNYAVWAPGVTPVWTTAPQTNATVSGLHPGTTYAWRVQAWDGTNWSFPSVAVDVTTAPDTVAPSTPGGLDLASEVYGVPVDNLTASTVLVRWTNSTDDFGPISYQVLVDGTVSPNVYSTRPAGTPYGATSTVWVRQLEPSATYVISVRAVDGGGNVSAPSNTLTVTTEASSDTTAPTSPTLTSANSGGNGACPEELWLRWTASTDDVDPASLIEYEVRVNGTIIEVVPGGTETIAYTETGGTNNVTIVAVDRAGNAAAPSNSIPVPLDWSGGCNL
jgi:chitodextrinase